MILKTSCLLVMFLLLTNLAYSQTSVCDMDKNKFCLGFGYLSEEAARLSDSPENKPLYNKNNLRLGVGYGLTENLKFTILPSARSNRAENSLEDLHIGFQLLKTTRPQSSEQLDESNKSRGMHYFVVGTTRTEISDNLTTEAIVGLGAYYKNYIWRFGYIIFADVYGKLQMKNLRNAFDDSAIIPVESDYSYQDNLGIEVGCELKIPGDRTVSIKSDISSKSPEISLTISVIYNN